jgi:uncharacterized membrane protein
VRHPLHPALVHFPIACWSLATFADSAGVWAGEPAWRFAGWLLVIGTATALAAMATGFMEFVKLAVEDPRAKHVTRHMVLVLCAWLAYAGSLVLRVDHAALQAPGVAAIVASVVGFALLCAAGWLGGQLVYREGLGVNRCARPGTG